MMRLDVIKEELTGLEMRMLDDIATPEEVARREALISERDALFEAVHGVTEADWTDREWWSLMETKPADRADMTEVWRAAIAKLVDAWEQVEKAQND